MHNKKGFTLIELIVVLAILAIIAAIAVPTTMNAINNAKVTADKATADSISAAVRLFVADDLTDGTANDETDQTLSAALNAAGMGTTVPTPQESGFSFYWTTNNKVVASKDTAAGTALAGTLYINSNTGALQTAKP